MDYFPAFLRLRGKRCLLVGGGDVAVRKARLLLDAGAEVTVVAPRLGPAFGELAADAPLKHVAREVTASDVIGHWLVVCATDSPAIQHLVVEAAESAGIFCNCVDSAANSTYITPAIVDRSPVIVAVSSAGAAPVLARMIRAKIEAMVPASVGRLAEYARGWRKRVNAGIGDLSARRRFWERFCTGRVAASIDVNDTRSADAEAAALLDEAGRRGPPRGQAWLVGAGPGDPGLLTLRALQVLQVADVIVHDRLVSDEVLALARRDADRIAVGKAPGCRKNSQEDINELLVRLVASGKRVCRLKGGDPFIFGRGGEEANALRAAGFDCQVVPGITAAAGCAAYSGIPLTHRDASQAVVLLTAHGKGSVDTLDWPSLARDRQTLAVYMGVDRFPELMRRLIACGRPAGTPVAIVENGTTPRQRVVRGSLGQLAMLADAHRIQSPAMLFIGEVTRFGLVTQAPRTAAGEGTMAPGSAIPQSVSL